MTFLDDVPSIGYTVLNVATGIEVWKNVRLSIAVNNLLDDIYSEPFNSRNPDNPIHLFQMYAATAQGYTAIAEELLASRPFDLFMMYFEQVDSFSHLFMKYAPPKLAWIDEGEFVA